MAGRCHRPYPVQRGAILPLDRSPTSTPMIRRDILKRLAVLEAKLRPAPKPKAPMIIFRFKDNIVHPGEEADEELYFDFGKGPDDLPIMEMPRPGDPMMDTSADKIIVNVVETREESARPDRGTNPAAQTPQDLSGSRPGPDDAAPADDADEAETAALAAEIATLKAQLKAAKAAKGKKR